MGELLNDRFIRALRCQAVDQTPVWMMRQAGRYLPEYRAVRKEAGSFLKLCKTPELATEVTLQPLRRYPLDAAILFSDILTIPDAMGLGLYFVEGEGPKFKHSIDSQADVLALKEIQIDEDLAYVIDAIKQTKIGLENKVPLIGFSGSPWTLMTYMVEGGSSKTFHLAKKMLYQAPKMAHQLLDKITDAVIDYLNAQIDAGVDAIQIFDTWGGILSTPAYEAFSLAYMKKIVNALNERERVPVILFTKNGGGWLEQIASAHCDAIGLDWTINLNQAKTRVGNQVALQGNIDPVVLMADHKTIEAEVSRILNQYGNAPGHVFNLGHGISPDVDPENAGVFIESVHQISKRIRA